MTMWKFLFMFKSNYLYVLEIVGINTLSRIQKRLPPNENLKNAISWAECDENSSWFKCIVGNFTTIGIDGAFLSAGSGCGQGSGELQEAGPGTRSR